MTTPDADDASPSPEYSGDQDDDMAAEQRTDGGSSPQKPANGHKPASNAKDPQRPRRKKARRACFACQRAHLTCGEYHSCLICDGGSVSCDLCWQMCKTDQDRRRTTL
jgi:hypothetical protein